MNLLIILNILSALWGKFDEIAQTNRYKAEGEKAFLEKRYVLAINKYNFLLDHLTPNDESIRLNLAHVYYKNNDTAEALFHYKKLTSSSNPYFSSVSNQQLGLIAALQKQNKKALIFFKEALKANPGNEDARFNYELIIKMITEEKDKHDKLPQKDKNEEEKIENGKTNAEQEKNDMSDHEKKQQTEKNDPEGSKASDHQNSFHGEEEKAGTKGQKDNSGNSGSGGEENLNKEELELNDKGNKQREALISRRLKKINLTEEKARMILEAMKNTETQYLQQIRKIGDEEYDKNKPDW
jgi:Ca-activated chloride channel family protein